MNNSNYSTISQSSLVGKQNEFYFEESKISRQIPKSSILYKETYNKIPVVLLLGWTGAIDRHIQKYNEIYTRLGYHTIRFSPSDSLTFFRYHTHKKYTQNLLNLLKTDYELTKNPIVTHIFSNACCFILYQHIINEINKPTQSEYDFFKQNHKAVIFDSAPGYPKKYDKVYRGVQGLISQQVKFSPLSHALAISFLALSYIYVKLNPNNYFFEMYKTVINDPRHVPSLYMYSTIDKLIPGENIKENIEMRKKNHPNLYVKEVVYDDAEHVLLYQKHPQDYLKHIYEHLKLCKVDIESVMGINSGLTLKSKL
ncbi:unnamed protein product [Brachionus calyciflorus]|uniref:Transmembrane protein 53 n=1 Tax=Brachionus calyciflorus TaxID=104777 RepID=A0A814G734_9BILA|nr:unnamed protein product [Brachionus calyciflorus]